MVKPINAPWELSPKDLRFEQVPITMHPSSGTKYIRWVDIGMPKIESEILDCVFYLYETIEDAEKGKKAGGTGFLVGVPSEKIPNHNYVYAVTNWHNVLKDGLSVIRVNNIDGTVSIFETEPIEWEFSPRREDIAVIGNLELYEDKHKVIIIPTSLFSTQDVISEKRIGIGDEVFMVGRFMDYDGEITNCPAVRFGNISIMPVPIKQPTGYMGKSYCLDLHSRTGFSGSPVFVYRTAGSDLERIMRSEATAMISPSFRYFLGIHWGQFPEQWEIIMGDKLPKSENHGLITEGKYVKGLSGMTCVIPAQQILELLNTPSLQNQRAKDDEELMKDYLENGFPAESESETTESENPQHKEDFTSLVSVAAKKKKQDD